MHMAIRSLLGSVGVSAFIAKGWRVRPFAEGNTCTVAVFTELYLGDLGFETTNEALRDTYNLL